MTLEQWESALETVLRSSLEPLRAEICVNTQRVLHLEDHVQALGEDLAMWPQHWNQSLGCLVAQLQRIVSDETSSDAQATLQEQLRQLIAALSSWNGQLKTELALQQQLIASLDSTGLPAASLELRVAQRALRDGCSAKEVTLMLVAGSEVVRQIHDAQGKKEAIAFGQHIVNIASRQKTENQDGQCYRRRKSPEVEIEA